METKSTNPAVKHQIASANLCGWLFILFTWALCGLWVVDLLDTRPTIWQAVCSVAAIGVYFLSFTFRKVRADEFSQFDRTKYRHETDAEYSPFGTWFGFLTFVTGVGWLIDCIICASWFGPGTFLQLGWWILSWMLLRARGQHISEAVRLETEARPKPTVSTSEERRRKEEKQAQWRRYTSAKQQAKQKSGSHFELSAKPGERTPYDADIVATWPCPHRNDLMYGFLGEKLRADDSGASGTSGSQLGLLNFAKVLDHLDLLDQFATFWSLRAPGEVNADGADFDCAIVTGSKVILIDIKYYEQGDVVWRLDDRKRLTAIDSYTGGPLGSPLELPQNMRRAATFVKNWSAAEGIDHQVQAMVVFMPTNRGIGTISPGTVWPGDVPVLPLKKALWELKWDSPIMPEDPATEATIHMFKTLLRADSSGEETQLNTRDEKSASSDAKPSTRKPALRRYVTKPKNEPTRVATSMPTAVSPSQPDTERSSAPSARAESQVTGPLSFGSGRRVSMSPGVARFGRESTHATDGTVCQYCKAEKESPVHACSQCGK